MLDKNFLSGHYQQTISSYFDDESKGSNLPSLIGAFSFTGQTLEAEKIFLQNKKTIAAEEKSACLFFLGVGHTRKSQYATARKIFKENQQSLTNESTHLQRFYTYQGIAFYLFLIGKLDKAFKWANKSFESALSSKDLYARSLSTDLLGHIQLRLGEINKGIDSLNKAAILSKRLGNKSISEAVDISELQFRAQYGHSREKIFNELKNRFSTILIEDVYSRAVLGLELARQLTLRGNYAHSKEILESISESIFRSENRRQEILLNLRFAENYYQLGREAQAWNYLRSARRCLNFETDKSYEIQILGFEEKLFRGNKNEHSTIALLECTKQYSSVLNDNILSRKNLTNKTSTGNEDIFHEFLTALTNDSDPIQTIIESGYWSLLYKHLDIPRGKECLYIDIQKNLVIIFSEKKIDIPENGLTSLDFKILLSIVSNPHTKEKLCKTVWGFEYDQLRHDSMIYSALSSLRKNLFSAGNWIETTEKGYALNSHILTKVENFIPSTPPKAEEREEHTNLLNHAGDLNLRQIKVLSHLKKNETIDIQNYKKMFKVSDITASRDLRSLKENGFVVSIGKARAIKYMLSRSSYEG